MPAHLAAASDALPDALPDANRTSHCKASEDSHVCGDGKQFYRCEAQCRSGNMKVPSSAGNFPFCQVAACIALCKTVQCGFIKVIGYPVSGEGHLWDYLAFKKFKYAGKEANENFEILSINNSSVYAACLTQPKNSWNSLHSLLHHGLQTFSNTHMRSRTQPC